MLDPGFPPVPGEPPGNGPGSPPAPLSGRRSGLLSGQRGDSLRYELLDVRIDDGHLRFICRDRERTLPARARRVARYLLHGLAWTGVGYRTLPGCDQAAPDDLTED